MVHVLTAPATAPTSNILRFFVSRSSDDECDSAIFFPEFCTTLLPLLASGFSIGPITGFVEARGAFEAVSPGSSGVSFLIGV